MIGKRVAFDDDVSLPAAPDMTDLARDELSEAAPQRDRRDQQIAVVGLIRVAGQVVEQLGGIGDQMSGLAVKSPMSVYTLAVVRL